MVLGSEFDKSSDFYFPSLVSPKNTLPQILEKGIGYEYFCKKHHLWCCVDKKGEKLLHKGPFFKREVLSAIFTIGQNVYRLIFSLCHSHCNVAFIVFLPFTRILSVSDAVLSRLNSFSKTVSALISLNFGMPKKRPGYFCKEWPFNGLFLHIGLSSDCAALRRELKRASQSFWWFLLRQRQIIWPH